MDLTRAENFNLVIRTLLTCFKLDKRFEFLQYMYKPMEPSNLLKSAFSGELSTSLTAWSS